MRSLSVDELFASLAAVESSASALARLREWSASIAHPAACNAPTGTPLIKEKAGNDAWSLPASP
ncbi:hypothetical protein ACEN88_29995 [Massilia sp. CT11-108]|uniref:hypothetical protein n=1 Tax=Massilia sp. CT11-108 TaxID=3393900 RepID=UPI0039A515EF